MIQIPYNVFDQRLDMCGFEKAKNMNVKIFAGSSLLQGLVLMDPNKVPEKVKFAKRYLSRFIDICGRYDCTPLKAAVGYVNSKSDVDFVVFGVDNIEHLMEYISIRNWTMPQDMLEEFQATFKTVDNRMLNPSLW